MGFLGVCAPQSVSQVRAPQVLEVQMPPLFCSDIAPLGTYHHYTAMTKTERWPDMQYTRLQLLLSAEIHD